MPINRGAQGVAAIMISTIVSGCGTSTPNIQEFWGSPQNASAMESNIAIQIACELGNAINDLHKEVAGSKVLQGEYGFIFGWTAEVQLTFIADEDTSFNPALSFIRPLDSAQSFTLGLTGTHKNQATRTDKVTIDYKVSDFLGDKNRPCAAGTPQKGTLFVQSDLKIKDWLESALNIAVTQGRQSERNAHPVFGKTNAISHDIKFDIVSSGGIAPTWKLVRFGTGDSPLVSGQRDRSQQLTLTMAPPDKANPDQLGPSGQVSSLSSQISAALRSAIRSVQ